MDPHILEVINSRIMSIEKALKEDIQEIKIDLRDLKEAQIQLSQVIVKLGNVEDKYNIQLAICKEARKVVENHGSKLNEIEKRLIPIEEFMKSFVDIKNKVIAGLLLHGVLWVLGLFTAYKLFK